LKTVGWIKIKVQSDDLLLTVNPDQIEENKSAPTKGKKNEKTGRMRCSDIRYFFDGSNAVSRRSQGSGVYKERWNRRSSALSDEPEQDTEG
jgi:hypothetical protein